MARKAFAIFLLLPLMLFFLFNGTMLPLVDKPLYEAGSDMPAKCQKVYYLLPENELSIPENKEFLGDRNGQNGRKYKLRDPHRVVHKNFHR